MDLQEARRKLYDKAFLLGGRRQKAALDYLAQTREPQAMDVLVEALEKYDKPKRIKEVLLDSWGEAKVERLWQLWAEGRLASLGEILKTKKQGADGENLRILSLLTLGQEGDLPQDRKTLRAALAFITDTDGDVRNGVGRFCGSFTVKVEFNDEIYTVWLKTASSELLNIIRNQDRLPGSPSKEALYYLNTGQVDRYHAMGDSDGELLLEAWLMAPKSLQDAISDTVLKSRDARLAEAYEKALLGREDFKRDLQLKVLKEAGDEEKLFEKARFMTLPGLLDLCERWSSKQWQSSDPKVRQVVERVVGANKKIGSLKIESGGAAPPGTADIFDYWKEQNPKDAELKKGLKAPDPFVRARSLYLGYVRGMVSGEDLAQAGKSDHWPERLIARIFAPQAMASAAPDHVEWINVVGGIDVEIFTAPVDCQPDQYNRFRSLMKSLENTAGVLVSRSRYLLEILLEFQGYFTQGRLVVEEGDSPEQREAIVAEDAPVAAEDLEFQISQKMGFLSSVSYSLKIKRDKYGRAVNPPCRPAAGVTKDENYTPS